MTTNRVAPLSDQLTARFTAQSYGARVEAGYRYGMPAIGMTPYAALQVQSFHTPSGALSPSNQERCLAGA
jgi:outer membrane autotransporter protein